MSTLSSILDKGNVLKLFAALAIPVGIVWVFTYSEQQANIEVKRYKEEQAANPTSDHITIKHYEVKEVDDYNQIRWQLTAAEGEVGKSNQEVVLRDVQVSYFDGKVLKLRLTAPVGQANESTQYVKLESLRNHSVIAEGEGGKAKLSAKVVELTKKNQFLATGGVNIEWPGVAKVAGDSATGKINVSDLKEFKISGNTHAIIGMK